MQLKCWINPCTTTALHACPIERTQTSLATHTLKLFFNTTFLYWQERKPPIFFFFIAISVYINILQGKINLVEDWNLTCFHPLHGFHKYGRATRRFIVHSLISFLPFKAFLSCSWFMRNHVFLCSNDSPAFFTTVYDLRFRVCFYV